MTSGRAQLVKGALATYGSSRSGEPPNVIPFQFNPNELSRSLKSREFQGGGRGQSRDRTLEARRRVKGPPAETVSLTLFLDATDQLEHPARNPDVAALGLRPTLAALEMLLYPADEASNRPGSEIVAPGRVRISYAEKKVPLVLFVWGTRALPVQLSGFDVTEQAFDDRLNPIRAEVSLELEVLAPDQLEEGLGRQAWKATHAQRKAWARLNLVGSARDVASEVLP